MSDAPARPAVAPARCVFCRQPVATAERCPLLPSSHWACCGCEAPATSATPARPKTGDAA